MTLSFQHCNLVAETSVRKITLIRISLRFTVILDSHIGSISKGLFFCKIKLNQSSDTKDVKTRISYKQKV